MISLNFEYLMNKIPDIDYTYSEGVVKNVIGLTIEVQGITAFVGEVCNIYNMLNEKIPCEVVGFRDKDVILMPLGELVGISPGCRVVPTGSPLTVKCSDELFGKVLDGLGNPLNEDRKSVV